MHSMLGYKWLIILNNYFCPIIDYIVSTNLSSSNLKQQGEKFVYIEPQCTSNNVLVIMFTQSLFFISIIKLVKLEF